MKLKGLRVLIVEDQVIIAMDMRDCLRECGCVVVGPAATLEAAVELARTRELDIAILDVNLENDDAYPVAEVLRSRGIPFFFATGYGESTLPEKWRERPRLDKPFRHADLEALLGTLAG